MAKGGPRQRKGLFSIFNNEIDEEQVEEEIISMVNEGHEQGLIETDEMEMISNVFEFGDKEAKDIMVIRKKIVAIEADMELEAAIRFMLEENYSRYPVYENDLDHVIGVLYFKDAMRAYMNKEGNVVRKIIRTPFFVHNTQSISKLFSQMQSKKIHMAIVLDEYGQTDGIVAMEDILEVVVGNILDEYDEEEKNIFYQEKEDTYLMKGMTRLEEIEDLLHISFPEVDVDTLNGFLIHEMGRLPKAKEQVEVKYGGYCFITEDVQDNMITQAKVVKEERKEED